MHTVLIEGDALQIRTAENLGKLAGLRGVTATIVWDAETRQYVADGTPCGTSVHGVYEWLDRQPGVRP